VRNLVSGADLLLRRTAASAATSGKARGARLAAPTAATPLPRYVLTAIAAWRLLHDVPFDYLVPDESLLPEESIRFFHLDERWLDQLARGATAVGGTAGADAARAQSVLPQLAQDARRQVPRIRDIRRGRSTPDSPGTPESDPDVAGHSGFLLRSALVSGWPGLQVGAYTTADIPAGADPAQWQHDHPETVIPIRRLERLAPSVLLAIFGGVPALVWLEEPHHGVQFGVEVTGGGYQVPVRDETGATLPIPPVRVPMRSGPPGVIDVAGLADAIDRAHPLSRPRGSAGLALSFLQPPSRQRFARQTAGGPA